MARHRIALASVCVLLCVANVSPSRMSATSEPTGWSQPAIDVEMEPLQLTTPVYKQLIVRRGTNGTMVIVDTTQHRLVLVEGQERTRWLGGIGNARGDLYYPVDVVAGIRSELYVMEDGNARIQVLDTTGRHLRQFAYQQPAFGMAVLRDGTVLVARPEGLTLFDVFEPSGRFRGRMGEFFAASSIPGVAGRSLHSRELLTGLHRVAVTADDDDSLWVAYLHLPIVRKLKSDGSLIWTKEISLPSVQPIARAVWQQPPPRQFASVGDGTIQLTLVLKGICADPQGGVVVLLGDNSVMRLRADGSIDWIVVPRTKGRTPNLNSIAIDQDGDVVLSQFLGGRLFRIPRGVLHHGRTTTH